MVEVEEHKDALIIRPVEMRRKKLIDELGRDLKTPIDKEFARMSEAEILEVVNAEIKASRKEHQQQKKK